MLEGVVLGITERSVTEVGSHFFNLHGFYQAPPDNEVSVGPPTLGHPVDSDMVFFNRDYH